MLWHNHEQYAEWLTDIYIKQEIWANAHETRESL